jgi:hypothetical protein
VPGCSKQTLRVFRSLSTVQTVACSTTHVDLCFYPTDDDHSEPSSALQQALSILQMHQNPYNACITSHCSVSQCTNVNPTRMRRTPLSRLARLRSRHTSKQACTQHNLERVVEVHEEPASHMREHAFKKHWKQRKDDTNHETHTHCVTKAMDTNNLNPQTPFILSQSLQPPRPSRPTHAIPYTF